MGYATLNGSDRRPPADPVGDAALTHLQDLVRHELVSQVGLVILALAARRAVEQFPPELRARADEAVVVALWVLRLTARSVERCGELIERDLGPWLRELFRANPGLADPVREAEALGLDVDAAPALMAEVPPTADVLAHKWATVFDAARMAGRG